MIGILAFEWDDDDDGDRELVSVDAVSTKAPGESAVIELRKGAKVDDPDIPEGRSGFTSVESVGVAYLDHWRMGNDGTPTRLVAVSMIYDYDPEDGYIVDQWWTREAGEVTPPEPSGEDE